MGPGNNTEDIKIMYKFEVIYANGKRSENPVIGISSLHENHLEVRT